MISNEARRALQISKAIHADLVELVLPPEEGKTSMQQLVIPMSVVRSTRGYIERTCNQINGSYENGLYDACAVMVRHLLEILIEEAFEGRQLHGTIEDSKGNLLRLGDLVDRTIAEKSWNLSDKSRRGLERLKNIGDFSAHVRRYNAHRQDIDNVTPDLRVVSQELLCIAGLKK